ncbi:MAG TPA: hypothetical protein VF926_14310 [Mycobacterium sp.]
MTQPRKAANHEFQAIDLRFRDRTGHRRVGADRRQRVAAAQPGPAPCQFGDCQGPGGPGGSGGHDQGPRAGWARPGTPARRPGWTGWARWIASSWPPDQGWRGIDDGRRDHQPFNYNGSWVTPIYNPDFNNWGFWFFGIWIPL